MIDVTPRKPEDNRELLDQRRTEILEAALKVFARRGLAGTKVGDIAATAGLSHGLLYHYFRSKDEIFTELAKIAYQVSLGTLTAATELPGTAWEKIKAMTEMIVSGAYQGYGPYYFLIILQAFTSEAVPEEVKKMTMENSHRYIEILGPLLEEAVKAGDIAPCDDPVQLATAYFALIQGLAIIQVQGGGTIPSPDPEIALRLIQGPVGERQKEEPGTSNYKGEQQDETESQAGAGADPVFGPVKLKKERLFYRTKKRGEREYTIQSALLTETGDSYRMESFEEDGARTVAITAKGNWRPQLVQKFNAAGEKTREVTYGDSWVLFDDLEQGTQKKVNLSGEYEYYDFHTLSFLFRAFPFGSKKRVTFRLVMEGIPFNAVVMYLQEIKREKVTVPAGTFDCFKLEMGVGGMAGVFAAKYRYYFWYPVTEPRFLVKYESADGDLVELTGEESVSGAS